MIDLQLKAVEEAETHLSLAERWVREAREALRNAKGNFYFAKFGVKYGARVRELSTGRVGMITEVETDSSFFANSKPWLRVALNKKDGSPGGRIVRLYGAWELVK